MATSVTMHDLMQATIDLGGSDLHVRAGVPPEIRIHGALEPLDIPPLTPEDTAKLTEEISNESHWREVEEHGGSDFALAFEDGTRFRVSVFKERGRYGVVMRMIPSTLLTMQQIGLPATLKEYLFKPRGLILVTGPTGSGKSTTLASMLNIINEERNAHIITIEDPIEYYHVSKQSLVTQREIGADVPSFAEAIRRALRQDPDVILVGEMPTEQQSQIRTQLSVGLQLVISQLLLKRVDKPGRVAAFEIMVATNSVRSRIRDNKTFQIRSDIQTGAKYGMITLDDSLLQHYKAHRISYDDLTSKSQEPDSLQQKLKDSFGGR